MRELLRYETILCQFWYLDGTSFKLSLKSGHGKNDEGRKESIKAID